MFLADYHVHSSCSFDADSKARMAEMARAELRRGITEVCFTDHCDIGTPETLQLGPNNFFLPRIQGHQFIEAMEKAPEGIEIKLGLELGEANHDPARGKRVYAMPEYDFILGSLHNLRGERDFYYLKYESEEQCLALYDRYLEELIELAAIPCFDIMAHIGYCRRYMRRQGFDIEMDMERFGDRIDTLLRTLIENGRGIELNCSGLSDADPVTYPSVPILRRYRELGGDIVTVGSDAHSPKSAGAGVEEGSELLLANGFRYVASYRHHKAEFKRLA